MDGALCMTLLGAVPIDFPARVRLRQTLHTRNFMPHSPRRSSSACCHSDLTGKVKLHDHHPNFQSPPAGCPCPPHMKGLAWRTLWRNRENTWRQWETSRQAARRIQKPRRYFGNAPLFCLRSQSLSCGCGSPHNGHAR